VLAERLQLDDLLEQRERPLSLSLGEMTIDGLARALLSGDNSGQLREQMEELCSDTRGRLLAMTTSRLRAMQAAAEAKTQIREYWRENIVRHMRDAKEGFSREPTNQPLSLSLSPRSASSARPAPRRAAAGPSDDAAPAKKKRGRPAKKKRARR
jgi:hypothetical protein